MDLQGRQAHDDGDLVGRLLGVARRQLGMDSVWMSTFHDGEQVLQLIDDSPSSPFDLPVGTCFSMEQTYVSVLADALPAVIPDTAVDERVRDLPITGALGIGAYIGASVLDAQGTPVGMVCCVNRDAAPHLDDDSVRVLDLISELVSEILTGESPGGRRDRQIRERVTATIADHHYETVFQPIVSVQSGRTIGVEALTRFATGPARPDLWFAEAHSVGLGVELELATFASALDHLDELPDDVYLALNASPAAVQDPRLAELVHASEPGRVVLELTEHDAIDDYAPVIAALEVLRGYGVRLAIDDVGAGFSSFTHVLELSPQLLKMDISITNGIDTDPARRALATAMVALARRIGATIVAEGVETEAELAAAAVVGISSVQGYLLGRPRPLPLEHIQIAPAAGTPDGSAPDVDAREELAPHQFELAMRHSPIGVCLVKLDGTFMLVNPAMASMLGYCPRDLMGLTFQELTHPDDLDLDLRYLQQCLEGSRNNYRIEKRYIAADGAVVWGDLSVVLVRTTSGRPRYFVSQVAEVTQQHAGTRARSTPVASDFLTGALNRPAARRAMNQLARDRVPFSVLRCRVRGDRDADDVHGIGRRNQVLVATARFLEDAVRAVDTLARWGDDEFVVILPHAELHGLPGLAGRLTGAGAQPIALEDGTLTLVELEIGSAHFDPTSPTGVDDLLHEAERTLSSDTIA